MAVKGEEEIILEAELVQAEPEIDLTASHNPPAVAPHYASTAPTQPAAATTTTTTYTIPPPNQQQQSMVQQGGPVVTDTYLGRDPAGMKCPYCSTQMVTRTRNRVDGITMLAFIILLFIFWPLCWLPFCIPSCKSTDHYCTKCNRKVGKAESCS